MSAEQLDSHEGNQQPTEESPKAYFTLEYDKATEQLTPRLVGEIPLPGLLMSLAGTYFQLMMAEMAKQAVAQGARPGAILGPNGMPLPPSFLSTFGARRRM